jgi:hypothetical protein
MAGHFIVPTFAPLVSAARGPQRTSQSTVFDLPAVMEPVTGAGALKAGGGVNCIPGFAGKSTGGCVKLGV